MLLTSLICQVLERAPPGAGHLTSEAAVGDTGKMQDLVHRALEAKRESKYVDFKRELGIEDSRSWCEIIKDIVAMANSGGGVILIGVDNSGKPTGFDVSPLLGLDLAVVSDRIYKYTGVHFSEFEISEHRKGARTLAAIHVSAVSIPIVFTKPGTYKVDEKKQKTVFSSGTVYFRHGAKSEPGNSDDIRRVIERQLKSIRKSWLKGVRKVVQAPPGSRVYTFPSHVEVSESTSPNAKAIRIVDDPDAPAYRKLDYDMTHPYRQREVIREVNRAVATHAKINQHDIKCVKQVYHIDGDDTLCHRSKFSLSPQYSQKFVDWLIHEFRKDQRFFSKLRMVAYRKRKRRH